MNINTESILKSLEKYGYCLPRICLDKLLTAAKEVRFKKGELILGIGEKIEKTYFIVSGAARSYYLDLDGNDVTKAFSCENSLCAGEGLFCTEPSEQGFEALEDIYALEFRAQELKQILLSDNDLRNIYIKMLEVTVIYKMKRENSFQLKSAAERYIDFCREYRGLENRVNQSCIASYLGITPVSLSRIRRTIREEN